MQFKQAMEAADLYCICLDKEPLGDLKFNSVSCYAHAQSNLAVLFPLMATVGHSALTGLALYDTTVVEKEALMAAQSWIERVIEAMPDGEGSEAYINMNNLIRQLGYDKQAYRLTWMKFRRSFQSDPTNTAVIFQEPVHIDCKELSSGSDFSRDPNKPLNVVCVKFGTKYGADYVNKLYFGVKKHLSNTHTFSCFTEDPTGLDSAILIQPMRHTWKTWWSKVQIFENSVYRETASDWVLIIDLDMIITGSIDN